MKRYAVGMVEASDPQNFFCDCGCQLKKVIPKRCANRGLISAVTRNDLEDVQRYLSAGADVHARNDKGLVFAAQEGYLEIVRELISVRANINAQNGAALILAASNGHLEVVEVLLKAKADVHVENDEALRSAAVKRHSEVVTCLLEHGATYNPEWTHIRKKIQQQLCIEGKK